MQTESAKDCSLLECDITSLGHCFPTFRNNVST